MPIKRHSGCKTLFLYTSIPLITVLWALIFISCSGHREAVPVAEKKRDVEVSSDAMAYQPGLDVRFNDFTAPTPAVLPDVEINVDPVEHPRLICDRRTARLFAKTRGDRAFEAMIKLAQEFWSASKDGEPAMYPTVPGILAASAFSTANRDYLALAVVEIDVALAPDEEFTGTPSLERLVWAAIGWDILGGMMSEPDRDIIAESARLALDEDIYPFMRRTLLGEERDVFPDDVMLQSGDFIRAYCAAFLWELAMMVSPEKMKELLLVSHPVLAALQEGFASHIDEIDFEFINGPIDDGLYLALLAWERASGAELIDRDLLRETIDTALESTREGFGRDGADHFKSAEGKAALMHLVKWRNELDGQERAEVDSWLEDGDYSPQVLMHVFLQPNQAK
jgi:hypothetical protein